MIRPGCAPPDDPAWNKRFAYVPYRVGPTPWALGDCWAGDALPDGPGPWADRPPDVGMLVWAPSVAKIGDVWWLFYTARKKDSGQQCIGVAASNRPTGPGWFHAADPLVCPDDGRWAIDPEIFYDRRSASWYLLWLHGPLKAQRFDPQTAKLVGPVRDLLRRIHPDLRFDEFRNSEGKIVSVIENPTMIRAANGQLWMMFSANHWRSGDYATGWAICGDGSPVEGGECALVNSFDPESRYRPAWGWSQRTAPVDGVNPTPYLAFPDVPGFGGMSVTVPNPTASGAQPVYAVAHRWNGPGKARSLDVYQMDISETVPALREPR